MDEDLFIDRLHDRVGGAWVTFVLVSLCVLVFAVEAFLSRSPMHVPPEWLITLGGNFAPAVQSGQAWRLLTSVFLHGSVLHIVLNMIALWQAGQIVERLFGRAPFAVLYLLSGILGALLSLWWKPGPVSIGASGAIFGVYGALLAYLIVMRGAMPLALLEKIRSGTVGFIGYSLFAGFMVPGIDNSAHIGGLLAGFVLGAGFSVPVSAVIGKTWRQATTYAALITVGAAALWLWRAAPPVAEQYKAHIRLEQAIGGFAASEQKLEAALKTALQALEQGKATPAETAQRLQEEVAPGWGEAIQSLGTQVVVPADKGRLQVLIQYAKLRHDAVVLLARGLASGEQRGIDAAANLRLQGDKLLLQWRLREVMETARRR